MEKRRVSVGETITITLPYSEVCMHMKVAGKDREVTLLKNGMAQLWQGGNHFSFPITAGEAGLMHDDLGWYIYQ